MSVLYEAGFDAASVGGVIMEAGGLVEGLVDDRRRLLIMVRELADNAVHHSGEGGGWCAVERSTNDLVVVVRDRGIGIHQSLRSLYSDIDERQAMRWVFGGGVSATNDPDRGIGLKMVLDYTRRGPTLLLESGGVAFVGVEGRGRVIGKSTQRVEGVVATIRVLLAGPMMGGARATERMSVGP